ncbi:MAG TPA: L-type lectin-domain containing protein [Planctomycetota bacterium]|nr:L-type lectin-domain containing protein [Planctomycetota bacterium]
MLRISLTLLLAATLTSAARADVEFVGFSGPAGLNLIGDASVQAGELQLTSNSFLKKGGAWASAQQSVLHGFTTTFKFRITDPVSCSADGLAFVIQNDSGTALGGLGSGLGYGADADCGSTSIQRAVAIEFDTWQSQSGTACYQGSPTPLDLADPDDHHVSVQALGAPGAGGIFDTYLSATANSWGLASPPFFADGMQHDVTIDYVPGSLAIFFDHSTQPILEVSIDLAEQLQAANGMAWVGFTAATGLCAQTQSILNWSFTSSSFHWTDLDAGLAGTAGVPELTGTGTPVLGELVSLELAGALPNADSFLFVGLSQLGLPFKGGTLVPTVDVIVEPLQVSPTGSATLGGTWSASVPPSTSFYFQQWIVDAGAVHGFAASNGLQLLTPGP